MKKGLENSERDGNTRARDLPLEKPICRSGSNSSKWTWNTRLVPNRKTDTQIDIKTNSTEVIISPYVSKMLCQFLTLLLHSLLHLTSNS